MLYVPRHNQLNMKYTVNTNSWRVLNFAFVDHPYPSDDVVTMRSRLKRVKRIYYYYNNNNIVYKYLQLHYAIVVWQPGTLD